MNTILSLITFILEIYGESSDQMFGSFYNSRKEAYEIVKCDDRLKGNDTAACIELGVLNLLSNIISEAEYKTANLPTVITTAVENLSSESLIRLKTEIEEQLEEERIAMRKTIKAFRHRIGEIFEVAKANVDMQIIGSSKGIESFYVDAVSNENEEDDAEPGAQNVDFFSELNNLPPEAISALGLVNQVYHDLKDEMLLSLAILSKDLNAAYSRLGDSIGSALVFTTEDFMSTLDNTLSNISEENDQKLDQLKATLREKLPLQIYELVCNTLSNAAQNNCYSPNN